MPRELLDHHVRRFNAGVRAGDFAAMIRGFADDAELVFVGPPVGPFRGRAAIAAAYRAQPPDDEIDVLDVLEEDGAVVARYAWRADPSRRAGELRLDLDDDLIRRLTISFADE